MVLENHFAKRTIFQLIYEPICARYLPCCPTYNFYEGEGVYEKNKNDRIKFILLPEVSQHFLEGAAIFHVGIRVLETTAKLLVSQFHLDFRRDACHHNVSRNVAPGDRAPRHDRPVPNSATLH